MNAGPISEEAYWALSQEPRIDIEQLRGRWQTAFDAALAALSHAALYVPANELRDRGSRLAVERDLTTELLQALARDEHDSSEISPLGVSRWEARELLGLPAGVDACVFNLDGVLIGSAAIHAAAWTETFDEFISRRIDRTGGRFAPFNQRIDYPQHMHGKPRLDGVRAFLASRGISLPDGRRDDPPGLETVHGLANRKNQALLRRLDEQGVRAFAGSRRYLETARDAGVQRAVVSASANNRTILERSGLADVIDASVDGDAITAEGLRAKPAPDILLAACRRLGVDPRHAAAFETSPAGIGAARAAGFRTVIAVNRTGAAAVLPDGADAVITGLAELADHKVAA